MAKSENQAIIDKNHGFMKFIIRNQHDRDRYDKEQKQKQNFNRDFALSSSKKTLTSNFSFRNDNNKTDHLLPSSSENWCAKEKRVKNTNRIDFSALKLDSKEKIDFEDFERLKIKSLVSEENVSYKKNENTKEKSKELLLDHVLTKLGK